MATSSDVKEMYERADYIGKAIDFKYMVKPLPDTGVPFKETEWELEGHRWKISGLFTWSGHPRMLWFKDGLLVRTDI